MMTIIESLIKGKRPDQSLCEDGLFIGNQLIAVIDGVTSKGKLLWDNTTSGCFAKDVLCRYLEEHEEELSRLSAEECLQALSNALSDEAAKAHPGPLDISEYPRAEVIIYNSACRKVWNYGDCRCIIGGELHSEEKRIDVLLSELRSFVIQSQIIERSGSELISENDVGRESIVPFIERQLWFENKPGPFGYPTLNGLNFEPGMIDIWNVPEGTEVILATDGYPQLCNTLAESEARLHALLEEDPLCISSNKETKGIIAGQESYDDRAYIRLRS